MERSTIAVWLGLMVAVSLVPGAASAQIVEVPTFQVGPATGGEETQGIDVAIGADGSLVAAWLAVDALGRRRVETRPLAADGTMLGPAVSVDDEHERFWGISPDPAGGYVLALSADALDGLRLDHVGRALAAPFLVSVPQFNSAAPAAVAVLPGGTLFAWWESDDDFPALSHLWARFFDAAGVPRGSRFAIDGPTAAGSIHVAATRDGGFVAAWMRSDGTAQCRMQVFAADGSPRTAIIPIAAPFSVRHIAASPVEGFALIGLFSPSSGQVEIWVRRFDDQGLARDAMVLDTASTATPTSLDLAFDASGNLHAVWTLVGPLGARVPRARALDANGVPFGRGEECEDGNAVDCDGCDRDCHLEIGLVCGDGQSVPGCGEPCDDGNATIGDGCSPGCVLERIPGGGAPATDCQAEWIVENAANEPLIDRDGHFSAKQRCGDGDPRCDFDGGTAGSCTFHVRVCANNDGLPGCVRGTRLATWELVRPSAQQALSSPAAAAVRAGFATVPGAIVGPTESDVCSGTVDVVVPLRGGAGGYKAGKLTLAARARLYDGKPDSDKLRLTCVPPPP